jgi:sodium/bile acid cotransporter 7
VRYLPDKFTLALITTVVLATLLPCRGEGARFFDVATIIAIAALFFQHGAKLSREAVIAGIGHWRLHILILASTFVLFPVLAIVLESVLPGALTQPLWLGLIFVAVLPSTVQSSIAFTSIAGGNVPAAIAAASASSLIGIPLTPLLASLLMQMHGLAISLHEVWHIVLQLFVPFAAGHLLRPWIGGFVARHRRLLSLTDSGSILLAVYTAFSAAVVEGLWKRLPLEQFLALVGMAALLLGLVMIIVHGVTRLFRFGRTDEIAILFCGSKKSLATGIPMANVLFAGSTTGVMLVPLMIFHQIQLMVCAWLARRYAVGAAREPQTVETPPAAEAG